jgi:hypothetical protein
MITYTKEPLFKRMLGMYIIGT